MRHPHDFMGAVQLDFRRAVEYPRQEIADGGPCSGRVAGGCDPETFNKESGEENSGKKRKDDAILRPAFHPSISTKVATMDGYYQPGQYPRPRRIHGEFEIKIESALQQSRSQINLESDDGRSDE